MVDGEGNGNCGESFFEGFYSDTESYDGTRSMISASDGQLTVVGNTNIRLIKENQFSQLSYFNRSQQSVLQGFTMPSPAGASERPSNPSD